MHDDQLRFKKTDIGKYRVQLEGHNAKFKLKFNGEPRFSLQHQVIQT